MGTFATVFLAELGDKTQLATLLLSAQSGRPLLVFIGSALALVASSLVGVLLGRWLAGWISPQRLELLAGSLMLLLGSLLGLQAIGPWLTELFLYMTISPDLLLLASTFSTVFLAELGDKTQLATVAISGTSNRPLYVFLGSASALVLASFLGALLGGGLAEVVPAQLLQLAAAIGFLVIGGRLVINALATKQEQS